MTLSCTIDRHVARVTFQSPKGIHILTRELRDELQQTLERLEQDQGLRVVVFAAEGRTFLAGADIHELRGLDSRTAYEYSRAGQSLLQRIEDLRAITVAAIHAPCAGGGCELALACDFRLAAAAAKIGLPEVSLGLLPGWGGTVRATRILGSAAARKLVLTGELLSASDAHSLRLVHAVHDDPQFGGAVEAFVQQLLSRAPQASRRAKRLLRGVDFRRSGRHFRREARQFAACYATNEPAIGLNAFLNKQAAVWEQGTDAAGT